MRREEGVRGRSIKIHFDRLELIAYRRVGARFLMFQPPIFSLSLDSRRTLIKFVNFCVFSWIKQKKNLVKFFSLVFSSCGFHNTAMICLHTPSSNTFSQLFSLFLGGGEFHSFEDGIWNIFFYVDDDDIRVVFYDARESGISKLC